MYIFLADDFLLVEINMEEYLFVGDIGKVEGFGIKADKYSFLLVDHVRLSFLV